MPYLRKPPPDAIAAFLATQTKLGLTYAAVGATGQVPPSHGYKIDHTRINLGTGLEAFAAAKRALERWEHFRLGWVEAYPGAKWLEVGGTVAVAGYAFGLWWLNACRIVNVVDQDGAVRKFGFTYGTLPAHAESGEERFLIEWDHTNDSVSYDILAFSRPHGVLSVIGYPLLRRVQARFRRDSAAAMMGAVGGVNQSPEVANYRWANR